VDLFVVGAGYVGLTTAAGFAQLGHRVTVHDIDAGRIESLEAGRVPIFEPGSDDRRPVDPAARRSGPPGADCRRPADRAVSAT
jgi:UDP-N-acetyl-D-mannosaminuronate dehydrogenase